MARSFGIRTDGTCRALLAAAAILIAWGATGCTMVKNAAQGTAEAVGDTSRKVVEAVTPGGGARVRHTLAVIGMESQFGPGRIGFDGHFASAMTGRLRSDCRDLLIDESAGGLLSSPPLLPSGRIDSFGLGAFGRPRGLEYVVVGTLNGLAFRDEKKGFWLWKGTRYTLRVTMRLEIVDSATGTKLLDEPFANEIELDENRYEILKTAPVPPLAEISQPLERILRDAAKRTCAALKEKPWQGFVTEAENGRLVISTGSAAGLAAGTRLEVFGPGRLMQSKDGQRFLKPGTKVGDAEVTSVAADRAEARLARPQPNLAGGVVRLK
jgi:hypothetical protein